MDVRKLTLLVPLLLLLTKIISLRITTEIGKVTFIVVWALQMHSLFQYGITSSNKSTDQHVIMRGSRWEWHLQGMSQHILKVFKLMERESFFQVKKAGEVICSKSRSKSTILVLNIVIHLKYDFYHRLVLSLKRRRKKEKYVKPQNFNSAFCSPPQCAISCFCCISVLAVCRLESK